MRQATTNSLALEVSAVTVALCQAQARHPAPPPRERLICRARVPVQTLTSGCTRGVQRDWY